MRKTVAGRSAALVNGVLIGAVLFLTILPSLGWAWHRVLPEHLHAFIGESHSDQDEILPTSASPGKAPIFCSSCTGTQIGSGTAHLPGNSALPVLGMALEVDTLAFALGLPDSEDRTMEYRVFYRSPVLLLPDPPPTRGGLIV